MHASHLQLLHVHMAISARLCSSLAGSRRGGEARGGVDAGSSEAGGGDPAGAAV